LKYKVKYSESYKIGKKRVKTFAEYLGKKIIPLNHTENYYGVIKMSFEKRLQKAIAKKEAQMEKEKQKIDKLKEKLDSGKITRAQFNIKKMHHEELIKAMSSRMRVLQGGLTKEKRHQEEKAEKKKEKKSNI
jgi:hypothetical protein